jgi:hypothetical protein
MNRIDAKCNASCPKISFIDSDSSNSGLLCSVKTWNDYPGPLLNESVPFPLSLVYAHIFGGGAIGSTIFSTASSMLDFRIHDFCVANQFIFRPY